MASVLIYSFFARRQRKKENEVEAQHNSRELDSNGMTPHLVISDESTEQPESSDSSKEKEPTSPTDGLQSPGGMLSPARAQGPGPGLTPLDSHASSTTTGTNHHHHHDHPNGHPDAERRARHKYSIRRPRALQYSYRRQLVTAGDEARVLTPSNSDEHGERSDISSHLPEAVAKQRERLDLFIDLIWVGIIGNLSEVFSTLSFDPEYHSPGTATLVFVLVFLPSWRIWNAMREFLNNYYMDDMVQRIFQFWTLACSVFYGNQLAYLAEDIDGVKTYAIASYLVILGSFILIEEVYSIFIPWLRKMCFFSFLLRIPGVALWVTAINLKGDKAIGPVVGAITWEYVSALILDSPLTDRFTPSEYRKALDVNHFTARMSNFFIIVLGEGVLQLVKDGPLGRGLNDLTGDMIWILLIYFAFSFLYFVRDGSRTFVPAVRHKGWRFLAFVFFHIPIFASLLTFVASIMFIIRHQSEKNYTQQNGAVPLTPEEVTAYTYDAVWTCSVSLAIIVLGMLILALLDRPLDKPGTLRIDNRYIRLSGRVIYIIVILSIPAYHNIDATTFLAVAGPLLVVLTLWEWNTCLEKGGGFIEPRGLSLMVSQELKGKRQWALAHGDEEDHNHPHRKFQFSGPLARI